MQDPSISRALSTISWTHFSILDTSSGLFLLYTIPSWKLPSPMWPTIPANKSSSSRSFFESSAIDTLEGKYIGKVKSERTNDIRKSRQWDSNIRRPDVI